MTMKTLMLLAVGLVQAWTVQFDTLPQDFQLFPRDASDSGTAVVAGKVAGAGADSLLVEVTKNSQPYRRNGAALVYSNDTASFSLSFRIASELSEYAFTVRAGGAIVAEADSVVCGDIYAMTGQSNMEAGGTGAYDWQINQWVRSAGYSVDSATQVLSPLWARASFRCCFGNWPYGASNGPNGAGMVAANLGLLIANATQTPVCILNGAYSGSYIEQHLPNPADHADRATLYGRLLSRARAAGLVPHIRCLLYYQGEYNNGFQTYPRLFDSLYRAWKADYPALERVYIEQVNTGCGYAASNPMIRDIQRRFGDNYPDITVMAACGIRGYTGCHYSGDGYLNIAQWWQPVYLKDFYGMDSGDVTSPRILEAAFASETRTELDLTFDMPVAWPADTLGYRMADYVTLDTAWGVIDSARSEGSRLRLFLSSRSNATTVSYLPLPSYRDTSAVYNGPYLRSLRKVGALTFLNFPISSPAGASFRTQPAHGDFSVSPNPFKSRTVFSMTRPGRLLIFDCRGILVADLTSGIRNGRAVWEPALPSGVYFAKFDNTLCKRIILMR